MPRPLSLLPLLHLPLLTLLLSHIPPTTSTSITFADYSTSAFTIRQECTSASLPSICCEPLDLDVHDGRGYGWFRATRVAFRSISTPGTITKVYGANPHGPCADHVVAEKEGREDWQQVVASKGGAGSASASESWRPVVLQRRFPDEIFLRGIRFVFVGWGRGQVASYRDGRGNVVFGRKFGA
ncbi:MAG: hypothetical protein Q9219_006641 [cf. Caloplaca sp. 3 TL-2023]